MWKYTKKKNPLDQIIDIWTYAVLNFVFWHLSSYNIFKEMNPDLVIYLNTRHNSRNIINLCGFAELWINLNLGAD